MQYKNVPAIMSLIIERYTNEGYSIHLYYNETTMYIKVFNKLTMKCYNAYLNNIMYSFKHIVECIKNNNISFVNIDANIITINEHVNCLNCNYTSQINYAIYLTVGNFTLNEYLEFVKAEYTYYYSRLSPLKVGNGNNISRILAETHIEYMQKENEILKKENEVLKEENKRYLNNILMYEERLYDLKKIVYDLSINIGLNIKKDVDMLYETQQLIYGQLDEQFTNSLVELYDVEMVSPEEYNITYNRESIDIVSLNNVIEYCTIKKYQWHCRCPINLAIFDKFIYLKELKINILCCSNNLLTNYDENMKTVVINYTIFNINSMYISTLELYNAEADTLVDFREKYALYFPNDMNNYEKYKSKYKMGFLTHLKFTKILVTEGMLNYLSVINKYEPHINMITLNDCIYWDYNKCDKIIMELKNRLIDVNLYSPQRSSA